MRLKWLWTLWLSLPLWSKRVSSKSALTSIPSLANVTREIHRRRYPRRSCHWGRSRRPRHSRRRRWYRKRRTFRPPCLSLGSTHWSWTRGSQLLCPCARLMTTKRLTEKAAVGTQTTSSTVSDGSLCGLRLCPSTERERENLGGFGIWCFSWFSFFNGNWIPS